MPGLGGRQWVAVAGFLAALLGLLLPWADAGGPNLHRYETTARAVAAAVTLGDRLRGRNGLDRKSLSLSDTEMSSFYVTFISSEWRK